MSAIPMDLRIALAPALAALFLLVGTQATSLGQETGDRDDSAQVEKLFDGKTLEGWSGDERFWRVEDGTIVGQTTEDNPTQHNTFLIWAGGLVTDFELRFKYKMDGGNSGVQVRSEVFDQYRVRGYQADFDAKNAYTGIWYEEGGRGILVHRCQVVKIDADGNRTSEDLDISENEYVSDLIPDGWNEVVVTARGNELTHSINGNLSARLIDREEGKARSTGALALQLHAGPPMKIQFKDIELRQFDPSD